MTTPLLLSMYLIAGLILLSPVIFKDTDGILKKNN